MKRNSSSKYKFKLKDAKKPDAKKLAKVAGRPLASFNVLYAYAMFTLHWTGLKYFAVFIINVLHKFFLVQYLEKFCIIRIPIKHVDHRLDSSVPYRPELAPCYLDFVNYWIRPMCLTMKRYGSFEGIKLSAEFVRYMIQTYKEAFKVYSHCLTTTVRPKPTTKAAKGIQFWDPHYLCVPSLHIAIVALTIGFYRMLFEREQFSEREREQWNRELYVHGIEIAESVLYMKQHSVNCIPAALYMITKTAPELFDRETAVCFIRNLFAHASDVRSEDKAQITAHIESLYEQLLKESETESDWTVPVKRWLASYEPHTSS